MKKEQLCGSCGEKITDNKPNKIDNIIVCNECFNTTKDDEMWFEGMYGENIEKNEDYEV